MVGWGILPSEARHFWVIFSPSANALAQDFSLRRIVPPQTSFFYFFCYGTRRFSSPCRPRFRTPSQDFLHTGGCSSPWRSSADPGTFQLQLVAPMALAGSWPCAFGSPSAADPAYLSSVRNHLHPARGMAHIAAACPRAKGLR